MTIYRVFSMQKRSIADSSKGKLHPIIFINIRKILWPADKDFFASKISHQESINISWKLDRFSNGTDVFQQSLKNQKGYAFAPICLLRILRKVQLDIDTLTKNTMSS